MNPQGKTMTTGNGTLGMGWYEHMFIYLKERLRGDIREQKRSVVLVVVFWIIGCDTAC